MAKNNRTEKPEPRFFSDLRRWLKVVDARGELEVVLGADLDLEVGALCELWGSDAQALLFDQIKGYPEGYRILTNSTNSASRIALSFGLSPQLTKVELVQALRELRAGVKGIAPKLVKKGPVLENVKLGDAVNLSELPAPTWHELDGGRFLGTADAVIQSDPDTGWVNAGTYRIQIHDEKTTGILVASGKHGRQIMEKYWERGQSCPVAVSVGPHPLLFMLSGAQIPHQVSELEYMGGIMGAPLEVIEGPVTGLPIPADSELVLEGEIPPGVEQPEGPFGEWSGYYVSGATNQPVIRVKSILHRDNPIILGGMPGPLPSDNTYFLSLYRSAAVWDELDGAGVAGVEGVWAHEAGGSYLFIVVSIKQMHGGHSKQVGHVAAFCHSGSYSNRFVVVVDEDIDPADSQAIIWALSTRVDPRTDIDIVDRCWGSPADPMSYPQEEQTANLFNSRVIIDACRPWERRKTFPEVATVSTELRDRTLKDWAALFAKRRRV